MLDKIIKGLAYLFAGLLIFVGLQWLTVPATAAAGLGMTLLDGLGRSTQIGDISAFFIVGGGFAIIGLLRNNSTMLLTPAALVAGAALFRTVAWLAHGAPFATQQIVTEVVMLVVFLAARSRMLAKS